ncbi:MAG TPA: DNA-directed RNA polymerase subunit D [Candidatus Nanoarchaeia archaeon]|nr:DNA-directed RNA polymerase subunit D [Candidatus Nanoarchaeia archaeon]
MKLEKIKEERKKNKLTFLIKDGSDVFVNTIRRLILEEVPTLAVEDLEIKDNGSALYDEMLGLRLGLTPIKTDLKSYELKDECKCGGVGCARCELKMVLKASKKGYVYAEEVKSMDPKCTFAYPTMPLAKLAGKQKIDIQLTAILGKGKQHTKWAPGLAFYKKEAVLKVGNVKDPKMIMENCTDGVFELKGNKLSVNKENLHDSHLLEYYVELDKGISLEETGNTIFIVESWGQLSNKEMLTTAADILVQKVEDMEKLI